MIFYGTNYNNLPSAVKSEDHFISVLSFSQQVPFYFLNSVPATIKLPGKIDLSFFRNLSIVAQYRYRLEIPGGVDTEIDRDLILWSQWTKSNMAEIKVPRLDLEGGYKLIVEYMTPELGETKKFEKPFYVYRANQKTNAGIAGSKTATERKPAKTTIAPEKETPKTVPVPDRKVTGTAPSTDKAATKTATNALPSTDNINKENEPVNNEKATLKDKKEVITPVALPPIGNIIIEPFKESAGFEKSTVSDYDKLLTEAIEKKDSSLFRKSILNGAILEFKGINGGNIFHVLNGSIANEELISTLKSKGIPINEADNNGNSPLHVAILTGEIEYARTLINQGADLNLKNNMELSPLHLAAYLNDDEIVKHLLEKGAEIDIKGNSGYTPLHIVTEMNHITVAKELLSMGAKISIKTNQKLTPRAIAKIQGNSEIYRLISKKDSYKLASPDSVSADNANQLNFVRQNPNYNFNLPYDKELAKKRQFNEILQFFSVPVFIIGTSITTHMHQEANNYYSSYKHAESEDMAKQYYDKTKRYDTYTYISGGVSLVSVYGFIHSTIRKKSISNKMYKAFD